MKELLLKIFLLFTLFFFSCNGKDEVKQNLKIKPQENRKGSDGEFINLFGKAKIGMSSKEFNILFHQNLKDTVRMASNDNEGSYIQGFKELDIDEKIKLKGVVAKFQNWKLRAIGGRYNKDLFMRLQKKYGGSLAEENTLYFEKDSIEFTCNYNSKFIELTTLKYSVD
jgi:hypothetical protein